MKEKRDVVRQRKKLREEAEKVVETFAPAISATQTNEILMHELMVHKVELEMQNEELRRANNLIEESRDRYIELYEFSPVAYISVCSKGLIREINLTGSVMLGAERFKIIGRGFSSFVAPYHQDRWHRLFMSIMGHPETKKETLELEILRADGSALDAYLHCVKHQTSETVNELHVTLTDISKLKNLRAA